MYAALQLQLKMVRYGEEKKAVNVIFAFPSISNAAPRSQKMSKGRWGAARIVIAVERSFSQSDVSYGMGHWTEELANAQHTLILTWYSSRCCRQLHLEISFRAGTVAMQR